MTDDELVFVFKAVAAVAAGVLITWGLMDVLNEWKHWRSGKGRNRLLESIARERRVRRVNWEEVPHPPEVRRRG